MIAAVCLNPSVDKTVSVSQFIVGGTNRILNTMEEGGGKGINVAVAGRRIGAQTTALGFMYRKNAELIMNRLKQENVPGDFVWCEGIVRTNTKVFDQERSQITELNENGSPVTQTDIDQLKRHIQDWSEKADIMVFSGSVPIGCTPDIYRELMTCVVSGTRCVLDTEGERLLRALELHPALIKPNIFELESIVGLKLDTPREIYRGACTLIERGAQMVVVSMGSEGALITDGSVCYYSKALDVPVKGTVGAGDSMVAALCKAMQEDLNIEEIFRCGVAGGTAGVITEGTDLVYKDDYERILQMVRLEKIV